MTKTAKNKEVLETLYQMVSKNASAPKPVATGIPGKEPDSASVSDKHDTVDQNAVKPETLKPQEHEQKPSTDPAKPTGGKKAEEAVVAPTDTKVAAEVVANTSLDKLGGEILALVQKFANNPVATGVPSKDPTWVAVSDKHDTTDQNAVKPETNPQGFHQKPAKDPAIPVAHAKSADDAAASDKVASYELGKLWAETVLKKAQDDQLEQVKQAGRRDFEALIAKAAEQFRQSEKRQEKSANDNSRRSVNLEKQAEAEGATAFQNLYKQAQAEQAVNQILQQNQALAQKIAGLEADVLKKQADYDKQLAIKQAELDRVAADEKEQAKFAALASHLENSIVQRLMREMAPNARG